MHFSPAKGLFYLLRPALYRRALRIVRSRVTGLPFTFEYSGPAMQRWCEMRALNLTDALARLHGDDSGEIGDQFPAVFREAHKRVKTCPVKMGGAGNLDILLRLCRRVGARAVVETGVAYGWSSLTVLLHFEERGAGTLYSTNMPYVEYGGADVPFVGCAVPENLRARWVLRSGADRELLEGLLVQAGPIDLCHYDSDKSYGGRMWAYPRLWDALKIGGCFVSDDIGDNLAFAHFCRTVRGRPTIVRVPDRDHAVKYVGILFKAHDKRREMVF